MVDERLLSYIRQQLQAGYAADAIQQFLIQNGYAPALVADAFRQLQAAQQSTQAALVEYIHKYLQAGYTPIQLEGFLSRQYPADVVENAMSKALQPQRTVSSFFTKKTLLLVFSALFILAVLAATLWFFMNISLGQEPVVSFSISVDPNALVPGQTLYITNSYTGFAEEREYPITIYYTLFDKETSTRVDSWQLAMDREDALVKNTKYTILFTTIPAEYELHAKMNYGTFSEESSVYFTVTVDKEGTTQETTIEIPEETEREEEITVEQQEQEDEEQQSTEEMEVSSYSGADDYKNKATATTLASSDPVSAAAYCDLIVSLTTTDECYWAVAKNSADKSYCEAIVADHTRDACWVGFAFDQHDYTVCANIVNPFIKQSCEQLEKVEELKAEYESG